MGGVPSRSRDWQCFFFFSRRFRGHASRSGKRQSNEHIIQRTSLLTMPIYFDNQFTIVPVQLLKGQWFIRIDQFWVTSCAALWGQTEAWLAVQSGMLSNARAWLTAHQHAELNSRTEEKKNKTKPKKCFPLFALTSNTHIKLWMLPCGKKIKIPHILWQTFRHSHDQTVQRNSNRFFIRHWTTFQRHRMRQDTRYIYIYIHLDSSKASSHKSPH